MAEFPCAAMRRRLFDPPKSIHLFIENHREFIEFYGNYILKSARILFLSRLHFCSSFVAGRHTFFQ